MRPAVDAKNRRHPAVDPADLAICASISVPFPQVIGPDALIDAVSAAARNDHAVAERWVAQLDRLFSETPLPMVLGFFDRHGTPEMLRRAYRWHRARRGPANDELEQYLASIPGRSEAVD